MANEVMIRIKVKDETEAGYAEALAAAREFGAKLKEELDKAGKEGGKDAGEEAAQELGDKLNEEGTPKVEEFTEKLKEKLDEGGKKAGEKAGKSAADSINAKLRELNLPELDVTLKTEDAKLHIDALQANLRELGRDNPTIDVKVKTAKAYAELEAFKKVVNHELGDVGNESGGNFATNLFKSIGQKLGGLDASLMGVGLSVAAAFAPLIGGAVAGAIIGGVGLGGIVGGVLIAARDSRVQSAFTGLRKDLSDSLKMDAAPFVPVVVAGIAQIKAAFHQVDLAGIFKDLAPQVQPLLSGVLDMLVELGAAIKNVVANSGPVIQELGNDFRNLGRTLADGFNMLADNSKQGASALHDLFAVLDGGIEVIFLTVNALTEMYNVFHQLMRLSLAGIFEEWQDGSQKVNGSIQRGIGVFKDYMSAQNGVKTAAQQAADANKKEADSIASVSDALKAATDPVWALQKATAAVSSAQGKYNSALKQHGANSKQARSAQKDLEQALIDYIGAASDARKGTGHLTDEQKNLLKTAGASADTIKDLDHQLSAAYNQAKKLDGFQVHIGVQTKYTTIGDPGDQGALHGGLAHGGISGAADGHTSSGLTWVGERGPELLRLPPGTSVNTNGDSNRMIDKLVSRTGSGTGGGNLTVTGDTSNLNDLGKAILTWLRFEIRTQGGHVQTVLGA